MAEMLVISKIPQLNNFARMISSGGALQQRQRKEGHLEVADVLRFDIIVENGRHGGGYPF